MHTTSRNLIFVLGAALLGASLLLARPAAAFWTLFGTADAPAPQDAPLQVCAVPQLHDALTHLSQTAASSLPKFALYFAPDSSLYAAIANQARSCDVLLTAAERSAILLIRAQRAEPQDLQPIAKLPLVLFSADPELLSPSDLQSLKQRKLSSLALPKAELTPVGFAAAQVAARSDFPTAYLNGRIYRAQQEYQVYAMVSSGQVSAGFVTLPLISRADGSTEGSYWRVPADWYDELKVYALSLKGPQQATARLWVQALQDKPALLQVGGIEPLTD